MGSKITQKDITDLNKQLFKVRKIGDEPALTRNGEGIWTSRNSGINKEEWERNIGKQTSR